VAPGETVRFPSEDGVRLEAELRGLGDVGVVLAPGYAEDRASLAGFAALLADRGYLTLALDFRGTGGSEGEIDVARAPADLSAAIAEIRAAGARQVFVVGAGTGAAAALITAQQQEIPLAGIVALSAPASFLGLEVTGVEAVDEPKLFFAAEGDGTAQATAQMLFDSSPPPKRVEVLVGSDNGAEILQGREAEKVRMLILSFLEGYSRGAS
jgi:pimeloyl-ACP methyl ester carboxylesterase